MTTRPPHGQDLPETPAILAIGTAVPTYASNQKEIGDWMAASYREQPVTQRLLRTIHNYSGIETRHSCTPHYLTSLDESPLAPGHDLADVLTTAERMAIYEREAPKLGISAVGHALQSYSQKFSAQPETIINGITHLIAVSCTGFFAPGLDFVIANQLGLPPTVKRSLIGFMGCSAAFNALRTAHEIVAGTPSACVLVVCVELCSLHPQHSADRDRLVASAIFSDGAAAAIVGQPEAQIAPARHGDYLALSEFYTSMKPNTEDEMVWRIGNHGFELRLSSRIPEHLADVAHHSVAQLFHEVRPEFWAIHPGGRAIVDRLVDAFDLTSEEAAESYEVLRRYGNMSSGTILFVLAMLWEQLSVWEKPSEAENGSGNPVDGIAMAFGPGLVIEMARLAYVAPINLCQESQATLAQFAIS